MWKAIGSLAIGAVFLCLLTAQTKNFADMFEDDPNAPPRDELLEKIREEEGAREERAKKPFSTAMQDMMPFSLVIALPALPAYILLDIIGLGSLKVPDYHYGDPLSHIIAGFLAAIALIMALWKTGQAWGGSATHKDFILSLRGVLFWYATRPVVWPIVWAARVLNKILDYILLLCVYVAVWGQGKWRYTVQQWENHRTIKPKNIKIIP